MMDRNILTEVHPMSGRTLLSFLAALVACAAFSASAQTSAPLSPSKPGLKAKASLKSDANPKKPNSKEPDGTGGDPKGPDGNPKGPDGNPPPKGPDGKRTNLDKVSTDKAKKAGAKQSPKTMTK